MNKNIRRAIKLFFTAFLLFTFFTCGGGGGGNGSGGRVTYDGVSTKATITSSNAENLSIGAFLGGSTGGTPGDVIINSAEVSEMPIEVPGFHATISIRQFIKKSMQRINFIPESGGKSVAAYVPISGVEPGLCNGSFSYTGYVNDTTGKYDLDSTFNDYSDDCETYISGNVNTSGYLDIWYYNYIYLIIMNFDSITIAKGEDSITMSGSWSYNETSYPTHYPSVEKMDIMTRDNATGKTYWIHQYEILNVLGSDTRGDYIEMDMTGTYFHHDYGYVDITTSTPIREYQGYKWPSSGILDITGDNRTVANLEVISEIFFRVTADTDGNGVSDFDSGEKRWPGANSKPISNAGSDIDSNVGCLITLDASGSSDPDGDPLSYHWFFQSIPPGSGSQLVNPDSTNPTFIPDLPGIYTISLIVNDGIDHSYVDMVSASVSEGIFCSSIDILMEVDPEAVAIGDLNNDGRVDVAVTTSHNFDPDTDYNVFIFYQNTSGDLDPPINYPAGNGLSVDVGDVNSDGKNDVVVSNGFGIGVFPQNNSGGLDQMTTYTAQGGSKKVRIGDFNNDSKMDVVSIEAKSFDAKEVYVFLQRNDGTLNPPAIYLVEHGGWLQSDLEVGDVDNDGLTDIVITSGAETAIRNFGVLLQNPGGTFDGPYYYDLGIDTTGCRGVAVGDVNGDNLKDVVVAYGGNSPKSNIGVFLQNSSGTLDPAVRYQAYDIPTPVEIADIDSDGRNDIVIAHSGWMAVSTYLQNIDGTLAPYVLYPVSYASFQNHGLALGDINSDGKIDAVIASRSYGLVVLYK